MKYDRVHRFEDIESWKIARVITNSIYDISNKVLLSKDKSFSDQMCRAALSIMNNIAEGFDRGSNKDFIKFLFIAKASCSEVRSMMYIALDRSYITRNEFGEIYDLLLSCSRLIWGLIKILKDKSDWKVGE